MGCIDDKEHTNYVPKRCSCEECTVGLDRLGLLNRVSIGSELWFRISEASRLVITLTVQK